MSSIQPRIYFSQEEIQAAVAANPSNFPVWTALGQFYDGLEIFYDTRVGFFYLGETEISLVKLVNDRSALVLTKHNGLAVLIERKKSKRVVLPIRHTLGRITWQDQAPARYLRTAVVEEMDRMREQHQPYSNDLLGREIDATEQRKLWMAFPFSGEV